MLDKISLNQTDSLSQSASLDRIKEIELKNPYTESDKGFFVDESLISDEAYAKYQREVDIKHFSDILMQTDEKEAIKLVMQKAFDGTISVSDTNIIDDITSNSDLLNDIL